MGGYCTGSGGKYKGLLFGLGASFGSIFTFSVALISFLPEQHAPIN